VTLLLILLTGSLVAFANGANDNFKGVATLLGSGTASHRRALIWATVTTALGSVAALLLAREMLAAFSGSGLVPDEVVADPGFAGAVALSAGATVLLAVRLGLPISTTHALIGGLIGAGMIASPTGIETETLMGRLLLPLLTSPLLAFVLAFSLYPRFRRLRKKLGITRETCVCVGGRVVGAVPGAPGAELAMNMVSLPEVSTGTSVTCAVRYQGQVLGFSARRGLDLAHYLSAGAVSFARGLNDTPKIAALLLVGGAISPNLALIGVGVAMASGGLLASRRVALTLSHDVTEMNPGQGFTANLVTSLLVIGASKLGMPVSTTHISCGSLFGIGAKTQGARWKTIRGILLAWAVTLPLAALLGALFAGAFGGVFA